MKFKIKFILCFIIFFLTILFLMGCSTDDHRKEIDFNDVISDTEFQKIDEKQNNDVLLFGFDHRASLQEDARQYLPFLEYLTKATGYKFELYLTTKKNYTIEALGNNEIQFTAFGAGSYIKAYEEYGIIPLVRGLNKEGKAEYQSVIFVAPDSPIQKIEELYNKRFAFGNITSTQGHLIPRIILNEHGITLKDLSLYKFTGSHRNCAEAVLSGDFDAGGMQDMLGKEFADADLIKIIYTSKYYPSSGIVANKDVSPEIMAKVKQALLDFQPQSRDSAGLYQWDKTEMPNGFTDAQDEDYAELRKWSKKFGLLDESEKEEK